MALQSSPALAGPELISIHAGSYHVNPARDFEEFNPGIFLTWNRSLDWSIGAYRNSYGELSLAGTAGYAFYDDGDTRLSLFGGVAYYDQAEARFGTSFGDLVPLAGLRVEHGPFFLQVIPLDGGEADAILSFGISRSFD